MLCFQITLKTITDFRNYISLFQHFYVSGYIENNNFRTEADDILALFCHYPLDNLHLCLTKYAPEEKDRITEFLHCNHLLAQSQTEQKQVSLPSALHSPHS